MTSSGHVTSRSCSGSGVPTTVAACCRPTATAGAQQSVDYKAFGMCSSFSRSAAREELVSTSRSCSPVVASRHGGDATAVPHAAVCAEGSVAPAPCGSSPTVLASAAPSLGGDERPSESEVGVVRATKNVTHVGSATVRHVDACVQSDAMSEVPGLTSKYYSCRKPLVLPEGHQNVGIGISPKELRLGFDESRKCTPLRHSDRSRHTQGAVAVAPRMGPVRCPACSQSNFVQPVHQRGIRHNNATNTLSSSPLFVATGGASAGNSSGQAGRSAIFRHPLIKRRCVSIAGPVLPRPPQLQEGRGGCRRFPEEGTMLWMCSRRRVPSLKLGSEMLWSGWMSTSLSCIM
ncbi:unnamed protein product [Trypanosoma congolense IL3000]|uniref:WGS project CAEQ00000000 data, annotated contig 1461 n=1 Tax=Trypanosoma congolense (strain IL3000) TaxID=1068625 RepID=F9W6G4_TRYCI|nr:unnamed protein product [Trypanosoma congolense IL3000]